MNEHFIFIYSLLQLRGAGSLARLEASLVPEMPHCAPPPGFASARATDVSSALLLLVTGYIAAFVLGEHFIIAIILE